jgi:hypothetical protein
MTAIIAAGTFILSCVHNSEKDQCPYLPIDDHIHQEINVPIPIRTIANVVATSVAAIIDSSVIYSCPDPNRSGSMVYYFYKKDL